MKDRCYSVFTVDYKNYGGRGIKVCDRWLNDFEAFLADMGERPTGMSIDRIDNDRDYEPGNCQWADRTTQNRNRRFVIEAQERAKAIREARAAGRSLKAISEEYGVSVSRACEITRSAAK